MRATGVEPAHRKTPDPKSGASANSATPAYLVLELQTRRRVSTRACNMDIEEVLINKTFVTSTNPSRERSVFLVLLHLLTCSLHLPQAALRSRNCQFRHARIYGFRLHLILREDPFFVKRERSLLLCFIFPFCHNLNFGGRYAILISKKTEGGRFGNYGFLYQNL